MVVVAASPASDSLDGRLIGKVRGLAETEFQHQRRGSEGRHSVLRALAEVPEIKMSTKLEEQRRRDRGLARGPGARVAATGKDRPDVR